MTRLIALTAKAKNADLKGQKSEVLEKLNSLGAAKKPVEFDALRKSLKKFDPKVLRMHVRSLTADKLATVKVQKAA